MRDLGELRDAGHRPEVGRRDQYHRLRVRLSVESDRERLGGDAVGDAEIPVDLRGHERRPQAREHQSVDDRGVDVSLDHHRPAVRRSGPELPAGVGERHADRVIPARGPVDQEPAALARPRRRRQDAARAGRASARARRRSPRCSAGRRVGPRPPRAPRSGRGRRPFPCGRGCGSAPGSGRRRRRPRRDRALRSGRPSRAESIYAPWGGSPPVYREYGYHHSFGATSLSMWTCLVS